MASIASLGFSIISRYVGRGIAQARRDIITLRAIYSGFNEDIKKNTSFLEGLPTRWKAIALGIAVVGPALVPLAAQFLATAGAAITLTGVAAGAGGVFAAAMMGAIKNATKLRTQSEQLKKSLDGQKQTLSTLTPGTKAYATQLKRVQEAQKLYNQSLMAGTPAQRKYNASIDNLSSSWTRFIDATQGDTLGVASVAVNALASSLKRFVPLVHAVAPLAMGVAKALKLWADTRLDGWVNFLTDHGVPALANFITIGKNLSVVFGDFFRAFAGGADQLGDSLARASAKLKGWADDGGFRKFLDYVRSNSPYVNDLLKAFFQAIWNIVKIFDGFNPSSMMTLTDAFRAIAAIDPGAIRALALSLLFMRSPIAWLILNCPALRELIIKILGSLNPQVIYAMAAAFMAWRTAIVLVNLGLVSTPVGWIVLGIGLLATAIVMIATKTTWFQTAWKYTWNAVKTSALYVWDALKAAWNAVFPALKGAWDRFAGPFNSAWHHLWAVLNVAWNAFIGPVREAWNKIWPEFLAVLKSFAVHGGAIWSEFLHVLEGAWNIFYKIFSPAFKAGWTVLTFAAKIAWDGLKLAWTILWQFVKTSWSIFWKIFAPTFAAAWHGLVAVAKAMWDVLKAAWQALWKIITAIFLTTFAVFTGHWRKAWNAIKDAASSVWNLIKKGWHLIVTDLKAIWDTVSTPFKKAWSLLWNSLKDTASSIWGKIERGTGDAVNGVIDIINGVIHAWDAIVSHVGLKSLSISAIGHVSWGKSGKGFADGGHVSGPGGPRADRIPAWLSNGEFVMNASAVSRYGLDFMHSVNGQKFADGGSVGGGHGGGGGILGSIGHAIAGAVTGAAGLGGSIAKKVGGWVLGTIGDKAIQAAFSGLLPDSVKSMAGDFGKILYAGTKRVIDGLIGFLVDKDHGARSSASVGGVIPTGQHKAIIDQALARAGVDRSQWAMWEAGMNTLVNRESSWNPNAVNMTDINAQLGHPSKGLAQVIDPTFQAYGLGGSILDPVSNLVASIRYIEAVYHGIQNVQQANAALSPKGYAMGTAGAAEGWHLVGENGPEMAYFRSGGRVLDAADTAALYKRGGDGGGEMHITLMVGSKELGEVVIDPLRKSIATRGGNVQAVLGKKGK